jgi:hypothetical protein
VYADSIGIFPISIILITTATLLWFSWRLMFHKVKVDSVNNINDIVVTDMGLSNEEKQIKINQLLNEESKLLSKGDTYLARMRRIEAQSLKNSLSK